MASFLRRSSFPRHRIFSLGPRVWDGRADRGALRGVLRVRGLLHGGGGARGLRGGGDLDLGMSHPWLGPRKAAGLGQRPGEKRLLEEGGR